MPNTRKKNIKNYIVVEKYIRNILGVDTRFYKINLNQGYECTKKLTLKKAVNPITKQIQRNPKFYNAITHKRKNGSKKFIKNSNLTEKLINYIKPYEKYTYCLSNDMLVIAETKAKTNKTKITKLIKNYTSKHFVICEDKVCASGELVIKDHTFIFDNSSGTYEPTYENIKTLKQALPFLNVKLVMLNSPEHSKYFN
jgi:hypothetical protein